MPACCQRPPAPGTFGCRSASPPWARSRDRAPLPAIGQVDGFDHILCCAWRGDNAGPHSPHEMRNVTGRVRAAFPGARVRASTFDAFVEPLARALAADASLQLPVVTDEARPDRPLRLPGPPTRPARRAGSGAVHWQLVACPAPWCQIAVVALP